MPKKPWWAKTTSERYKDHIKELEKSVRMDKELAKYGRRIDTGGMVWTAGGLARYFLDLKKRGKLKSLKKRRRR